MPSGRSLQTDDESALIPLREALEGSDPDVVIPAIRAVMWRGDAQSSAALEKLLVARDPSVQLAAAEALARVGNPSVLATIWQALDAEPDPFLEHALVHAAHRLADAAALQQALGHPSPVVQKAALLLLDQPPRPPNALGHEAVIDRLGDKNPELRQAARQILARHPEWASHAVDFLRDLLVQPALSQEDEAALADLVLAFVANDQVQELIAAAIRNEGGKFPAERRVQVLELISRSTVAEIPRVWVDALAQAIDQSPPEVRLAAVRCAAVLQISELDDRLDRLANSPDEPAELRREALRAIVPRRKTLRPQTFDLLMNDLSSEVDPVLRLAAAELFGQDGARCRAASSAASRDSGRHSHYAGRIAADARTVDDGRDRAGRCRLLGGVDSRRLAPTARRAPRPFQATF